MSPHKEDPVDVEKYIRHVGFDTKWRENWWRRDFLELLGRRLGFERVTTMLDVGCGAGHWGRRLAEVLPAGTRIAGVDVVPAFIERSRALAEEAGLGDCDYRAGRAEALPYDDNSFDLVTCQTLLIHIKDPVLVLREMTRVLKPGGRLLLAEPNNLTGFLPLLQCRPRPAPDVVLSQMDFYATCLRGKKALGWGDTAIGDQLPAMIAALGLRDVQVAQNEKHAALVPPYETEEQQLEIAFLSRFQEDGLWLGFAGDTENFYRAGGGGEAAFPGLLAQAMAWQDTMFAAIAARTFAGSLGAGTYIIAGTKPAA